MIRKSTLNRTLKFMLTLCGVWPGVPCIVLCRICWIITVIFILFCHYRYFLTHIHSAKLMDLMDCMSSFFAYAKVIIKFLKIHRNLGDDKEDWNDCDNGDVISIRETERKAKISDRITNAIVTLHTTTIVAYCIGIILADVDVTQATEIPLLNKLEIPFNISTQRMYRFVLIIEFVFMLFSVGRLILHTAGQIDIIRSWLLQLVPRKEENKRIPYHIITSKIIRKHQKIISFSENIESLYSYIAPNALEQILKSLLFYTITNLEAFIFCFAGEYLSNSRILLFIILRSQKQLTLTVGKMMNLSLETFTSNIESLYSYIALLQFISNTIMICSLAFVIVTSQCVRTNTKVPLILHITNLEAFIFCFAGEYLSSKSKEIGVAAYNCAWYDLKSKDSRILLFIILRSQKQLTLTVGKMMNLSLETFTSIMNASGSYLSVLLTMQ
ncbi:Odorant receptor 284 [Nylanderia fulva]|uniref:Odorant receptor n=1 Tax=Nylanderia fulva TaxID=613905 RepID=A0A6G1LPT7_9HYME|nr:Odorant receptor 284 [Nylanderia fulva]